MGSATHFAGCTQPPMSAPVLPTASRVIDFALQLDGEGPDVAGVTLRE
jgi:hypothetical protein